jgi:hypothetical protein
MNAPSRMPLRFGAFELDQEADSSAGPVDGCTSRRKQCGYSRCWPAEPVRWSPAKRSARPCGAATRLSISTAVNACVSQIRMALGDKPTAPRFVETVPRRGYRFVSPVFNGTVQSSGASTATAAFGPDSSGQTYTQRLEGTFSTNGFSARLNVTVSPRNCAFSRDWTATKVP